MSEHYGLTKAAEIRDKTTDYNQLTEFEAFVLDRGERYRTRAALESAYDRFVKFTQGEMITEDAFLAEVGSENFEIYGAEILRTAYKRLVDLVQQGKTRAEIVYQYAAFKWCLKNPFAIKAIEVEKGQWIVNTCSDIISDYEAVIKINHMWGFEASRVKITGAPFYTSTDWQFIEFSAAGVKWLWANDELHRVYDYERD